MTNDSDVEKDLLERLVFCDIPRTSIRLETPVSAGRSAFRSWALKSSFCTSTVPLS